MQLFFNALVAQHQKEISFDKEESRHIVKVLRKNVGDQLHVTNGKGSLFLTTLKQVNTNTCIAEVVSEMFTAASDFHIHLAVSPTKMNERYEWFLEKATEIGIHEITPIFCHHSERKVIKPERFEKVLIAATKQSLQQYTPILNEAISFTDFIKKTFTGQKFIAHCEEESSKKSLKNEITPKSSYTILIGPEGDFSVTEIQLALADDFIPISLGDTRLRTETAALVACHTAVLINEIS